MQVVLRVLQSLHGLWAPDFKPLIAPPWHDVFRGDEQDAALTEAQRGNVAVAHLWEHFSAVFQLEQLRKPPHQNVCQDGPTSRAGAVATAALPGSVAHHSAIVCPHFFQSECRLHSYSRTLVS